MGGAGWDFNIRGIYHGTRPNDDETQFWLQHDYLIEKGPDFWKGIVGWYMVRVAHPDDAPKVAKAIDAMFANSASETRTQSEASFAAAFVQQMGNIEFLIRAIGSIVFFTLLLVTGNTMAIAVRERTNELATLKAIGYPARVRARPRARRVDADRGHRRHAGTVAGELPHQAGPDAGADPAVPARDRADRRAPAIALGTGLLAGLVPALNAMRLNVATALRRL